MLTMTVVGKNDAATDCLAGLDLLVLGLGGGRQPTPTAVATAEAGGTVPATLALTLGGPPAFGRVRAGRGARVHGGDDGQRDLHRRATRRSPSPTPGT